jgi:hypothetical protein
VTQAVFDIEADALDARDVKNVWCIVIHDLQTGEQFKYGPENIQAGVEKLNSYGRCIGHNIISYDIPVLARFFNIRPDLQLIDTLVLSRLANPDRGLPWGWVGKREPHSIKAWAVRMGMKPKIEHDEWDKFSDAMMERCVHDVAINVAVYKALVQEFKE